MADRALAAEVPADANISERTSSINIPRLNLRCGCCLGAPKDAQPRVVNMQSQSARSCRLSWNKQRNRRQIGSLRRLSQSGDMCYSSKRSGPGPHCYRAAHATHQAQDLGAVWEGGCWQEHIFSTTRVCPGSKEQRGDWNLLFALHGMSTPAAICRCVISSLHSITLPRIAAAFAMLLCMACAGAFDTNSLV